MNNDFNLDDEIKKTEEELKRLKQNTDSDSQEDTSKKMTIISVIFTIILISGAVLYSKGILQGDKNSAQNEYADIVSTRGVHFHPNIEIIIKGEKFVIPTNTGIKGNIHEPMHTHDLTGTVHIEIPGVVKNDDLKISRFFNIWGKTFNKECIFDNCNGSEGKVKMIVNGIESDQFEDYSLRDGDKIRIIFE